MASKIDDRIKDIETKLLKMKAQKKAQESAKAARDSKQKRAADTRKKILVGAAVLSEAANDPIFAASLAMILEARITRDDDRKISGLEPLLVQPGQKTDGVKNANAA